MRSKFIIKPDFWQVFPQTEIAVITAKGIDNSGDLLLTHAIGGEPFLALGDEKESEALPGEVVYKDDKGIVCRCWNWRDGQRTMLTTETTNAFLVIESVDPSRSEDLKMAAETLASMAEQYLGGQWEVTYMTAENSELMM